MLSLKLTLKRYLRTWKNIPQTIILTMEKQVVTLLFQINTQIRQYALNKDWVGEKTNNTLALG